MQKIIIYLLLVQFYSLKAYTQSPEFKEIKDLQVKLKKSKSIQSSIEIECKLGSIYLYRPESLTKDMDSANYYFQKAYKSSDSIGDFKLKNQICYYMAEAYFEQKKYSEGYELYLKCANFYKLKNELKDEAQIWLKIANRIRNEVSIDNVLYENNIENYNNALNVYRKLGQKVNELNVLKEIADYHLNQGLLNKAEKELLYVLEEYKKINFPEIHHTYNLLCTINRLNGDFNKSLFNGLKAVELMQKNKDTIFTPYFYGNVADSYRDLSETEQSIIWYNKAIANWENNNYLSSDYLYRCVNYLCKQLILSNRQREALDLLSNVTRIRPPNTPYQKACSYNVRAVYYKSVKQFDTAEKEYLNLLKWMNIAKNEIFLALVSEANFEVAGFYLERKQYGKAKQYINESLNIPDGILTKVKVKDANLILFKIDSTEGNFFQAISHFQKYKQINDSIFNETKSKQIEELQIQYETVKNETDIKSLRNENLLKNNQLTKALSLKNLIFGVLIVFFLLSVLLYRSYGRKQRTNRILVSQKGEIAQQNASLQELLKEKEWLLREIHHRVKNNLQIVMSLLNTQSNFIKNEEALYAVKNSQHRLFAISLIHQKLYKTENATLIDMNSYIKDLVGYLKDSFDINSNIDFKLEIEHIMLQEDQSIPVGLILNESITNAIKYAFPNQQRGMITIIMTEEKDNYIMLIKDDGVGIPDSNSLSTSSSSSSLGMTLIKGLTGQLDGEFYIKNREGTLIEVVFKKR